MPKRHIFHRMLVFLLHFLSEGICKLVKLIFTIHPQLKTSTSKVVLKGVSRFSVWHSQIELRAKIQNNGSLKKPFR